MDLLNNENKDLIINQIDQVIKYSQCIHVDLQGVNELYNQWAIAKSRLFNLFGNKLIWEICDNITFELSEKSKQRKLSDFIDRIFDFYNNHDLGNFLLHQSQYFFENKTCEDFAYGNTIIRAGTKIVKDFKYFCTDNEELTKLQDEASVIIQENKLTGTLCISIHPLDYLSSSENTYNWRSCHSLDGEYRAGNLDYMVDGVTMVCYLRGANNVKLPNFPEEVPWNSKKWRMLLHMDRSGHLMFAGRQYPFDSDAALQAIEQIVAPKIMAGWRISSWHDDVCDFSKFTFKHPETLLMTLFSPYKYIMPGGIPRKLENIIRFENITNDDETPLHYSDLLYSSYYSPYYLWSSEYMGDEELEMGKYPICPVCGKRYITGSSDKLTCSDCEQYAETKYCSFCDSIIHDNDPIYHMGNYSITIEGQEYESADDDIVCQHCATRYTFVCDACGGRFYNNRKISCDNHNYCSSCFSDKKIIYGERLNGY